MENDLPIIVFDLNKPDNIRRVALGERVGTLISRRTRGASADERPRPSSSASARWPGPSRSWSAISRRIRTGRASTSLVERILVDYYGTPDAAQPARRHQRPGGAPDRHPAVGPRRAGRDREGHPEERHRARCPNVDGTVVRLNIPPLTEERRNDLVRLVHKRMEEARVEIRNLRREAPIDLKKEEKDGDLGTDEMPSRARRAAEGDRPVHRRGRPRRASTRSRRSWRSSGADVRVPLARPTDAPPIAHAPAAALRRRTDAGRAGRHDPAPTCRATSRSSWTAIAAGPASAASPSSRVMPPGSRRSGAILATRSAAASGS